MSSKPKPLQARLRVAWQRGRARLAATRARIDQWFPDREFIMRAQGQVRFIRLSARTQKRAATGALVLALAYVGSIGTLALIRWHDARDASALLGRQARVEKAESRVAAYRRNLDDVTADLKRRQDFIEKVTQAHLGVLPDDSKDGETVTNSHGEATRTIDKVSTAVPEAANLARMEARQLAFVESLTRYADRRAARGLAMMRRLGVDPGMMLGGRDGGEAGNEAMGGPLLALSTEADGALDPRFARLGASLSRMSALDRALSRMPQVLPASADSISSGFGYRADPFTRHGSFHPGLDFRGPVGAGIYAAARGTVSFVGQRSGYGNCVEVTHGPGLVTRYAHMSAFYSHVGQQVAAGQLIGAIGSTGPHLHFEVRINGRPTNPRPFLEARSHVPSTIVSPAAGPAPAAGAAQDPGPSEGSE